VVYWKPDAVAVVPIIVAADGHILARVKLDGQTEYAMLDTGAWNTTLTDREATLAYGLKLGSADTPDSGAIANHPELRVFRHQFKSLEFEGISVANPDVAVVPDKSHGILDASGQAPTGSHIADSRTDESHVTMLIGMNVLRHFHLYIAYKEQKLYITAAGAPAASDASATEARAAH
jgi:predicted aspartyl protease